MTTTDQHPRATFPLADIVISTVLAAIFLAALIQALEWSVRAGLFPLIVTGLGLALAFLHIAVLLVRWFLHRPAPVEPASHILGNDDEVEVEELEYVFASAGRRAWTVALLWVAGFFVGLYVLGLLITAPLFAVLYLRFSAGASWRLSIAYALVSGAVLYGIFEVALRLPIPPGLFL